MKLRTLKLTSLVSHSQNARERREYTKKETLDLVSSIREHGLLQPLVVVPAGEKFTILAGHRRRAALIQLGSNEAPCVVWDGDEQESLAVLLGENASHKAVDPLREATAVAKLVEGFAEEKAPYERAASVLGKSVGWVRGRMRLTALSEAWRKAHADTESPIHEWPVGHLELMAALPEPVQDEILEEWTAFNETGIPLLADLKASLARSTCDLAKVPWDREKTEIVEGAPACSACPFRASAQGVLFPNDTKGDRCLNSSCFEAKRKATVAARIVEAREKHGETLRVETTFGLEDVPVPDGTKVHREFELHAKSKAKGGFPVLRLRTLEVVYMAEAVTSPASARMKEKAKRARPKPMSERREDLEKRRLVRAIEVFRGCMLGTKVSVGTEKRPEEVVPPEPQVPELLDVASLVAAYGTGAGVDVEAPRGPVDARTVRSLIESARHGAKTGDSSLRARLWSRVRAPIARAVRILGPTTPKAVADFAGHAEAICGVCGLDWETAFVRPAVAAIAEPKSWTVVKPLTRRRRAG